MAETTAFNDQINNAWRQLGLFGELPWAAVTTLLAWVGSLLSALNNVATRVGSWWRWPCSFYRRWGSPEW